MDYKYITQLLERYWEGTTSLEEEQILKAFFSQKDIPAELLRYKPLFDYQTAEPRQDVLAGQSPYHHAATKAQTAVQGSCYRGHYAHIGQCGAGFHDRQFGLNSAEQQHECRHT